MAIWLHRWIGAPPSFGGQSAEVTPIPLSLYKGMAMKDMYRDILDTTNNELLAQLLGATTRSVRSMASAVTFMAFEQLRSQDADLQRSARRMIKRMHTINLDLDKQLEMTSNLLGRSSHKALVEPVELSSKASTAAE